MLLEKYSGTWIYLYKLLFIYFLFYYHVLSIIIITTGYDYNENKITYCIVESLFYFVILNLMYNFMRNFIFIYLFSL